MSRIDTIDLDELLAQRMDDPKLVAEAIDEIAGTSDHNNDGNTLFAASLATAILADDASVLESLRVQVRAYLTQAAETDVELEIARRQEESDEMREFYRNLARERAA